MEENDIINAEDFLFVIYYLLGGIHRSNYYIPGNVVYFLLPYSNLVWMNNFDATLSQILILNPKILMKNKYTEFTQFGYNKKLSKLKKQ